MKRRTFKNQFILPTSLSVCTITLLYLLPTKEVLYLVSHDIFWVLEIVCSFSRPLYVVLSM